MTEPAVALTDFGLAIECAFFVWLLMRGIGAVHSMGSAPRWFGAFFAASGVASLTGGIVHGFFLEASAAHTLLWQVTLTAVGFGALALSMIALALSGLYLSPVARGIAIGVFILCLAATLTWPRFVVVMAAYLPAVLFLFVVFLSRYRERRDAPSAWGIAGLLVMCVGAAIQQLGPSPFPTSFNHNAVFHVVQSLALLALFFSARTLTSSART